MPRGSTPEFSQEKLDELFLEFQVDPSPEMVDSGSEIFNAVVGREGIPRGVFIELCASFGVGKSTALLHICKRYCDRGEMVVYLDHEQGVNQSQLEGMGISKHRYDPETNPEGKFYLLAPTSFEDADKIFNHLIKTADPSMIVIDSVSAMIPGKMIDKGVEEIEPGLQARYCSNFLMKYKSPCRKKGITVWLINQVRTQIRFRGVTTVEPSGGNALKHFCDIRLMMDLEQKLTKTMENMSGKDVVQYGSVIKLFALKNRWAPPYRALNLAIYFGKGVSNIYSYIEFMKSKGICSMGSTGVYTISLPGMEEPIKKRGYPLTEKWVRENLKDVKQFVKDNGGFKLEGDEETE